jgi:hypothetical protein
MTGIPYVFTISHVAKMLGEDEEWLREISINMDPEEGQLNGMLTQTVPVVAEKSASPMPS